MREPGRHERPRHHRAHHRLPRARAARLGPPAPYLRALLGDRRDRRCSSPSSGRRWRRTTRTPRRSSSSSWGRSRPRATRWASTATAATCSSRLMVGARTSMLGPAARRAHVDGAGDGLAVPAAWRGGWLDSVLGTGMDILFAFPGILLAVLTAAVFGAGLLAPRSRWRSPTRPTSRASCARRRCASALRTTSRRSRCRAFLADDLRPPPHPQPGRAGRGPGHAAVRVGDGRPGGDLVPRPRRAGADGRLGRDGLRRARPACCRAIRWSRSRRAPASCWWSWRSTCSASGSPRATSDEGDDERALHYLSATEALPPSGPASSPRSSCWSGDRPGRGGGAHGQRALSHLLRRGPGTGARRRGPLRRARARLRARWRACPWPSRTRRRSRATRGRRARRSTVTSSPPTPPSSARRILDAGAIVHARSTNPEFSCAGFTHSRFRRRDPQPAEPGVRRRRLVGRFGRVPGRRQLDARQRLGHRRVDPDPGVVQRRGRLQAPLWAGAAWIRRSTSTVLPLRAAGAHRCRLRALSRTCSPARHPATSSRCATQAGPAGAARPASTACGSRCRSTSAAGRSTTTCARNTLEVARRCATAGAVVEEVDLESRARRSCARRRSTSITASAPRSRAEHRAPRPDLACDYVHGMFAFSEQYSAGARSRPRAGDRGAAVPARRCAAPDATTRSSSPTSCARQPHRGRRLQSPTGRRHRRHVADSPRELPHPGVQHLQPLPGAGRARRASATTACPPACRSPRAPTTT